MNHDTHQALRCAQPLIWFNPARTPQPPTPTPAGSGHIGLDDMRAAQARFTRFAPLLARLFPELSASHGHIRSPLLPVPAMQQALGLPPGQGRLWVKADHSLPVAGSIKARGGFHEVLELCERIALQHGLLAPGGDTLALAGDAARAQFARHQVAVGSTGNLGLSIGVMAAALGFEAVVHMSAEAKDWKKQRLRGRGVRVVEHAGDYGAAVAAGRCQSQGQPDSHFVDDEQSLSLLLGYSAAAFELAEQLTQAGIGVDAAHPLYVYLPCGVGGAPGGIAWGLQQLLGPHVHCFFAEPVQSPCFLVQMLADEGQHPSVYDWGLSNQTEADGLAVARASLLAVQVVRPLLAGCYTVADATLLQHLALLHDTEGLRIEPSAAAGFSGPLWLHRHAPTPAQATHVVWTTGGLLVPEAQYQGFLAAARAL